MSKKSWIKQQTWSSPAPAVAASTGVHAAISTAAVITSAITQPDVPRTIRIVSAGSGHSATGAVVINGTDIKGNTISDSITLNGNTAVDGIKAFASVTSIDTTGAAAMDANNTITVGLGAALGLEELCNALSFKGISGVTSFASDIAVISKNVVTLSASLDGSTAQAIIYIPDTFYPYGRLYN